MTHPCTSIKLLQDRWPCITFALHWGKATCICSNTMYGRLALAIYPKSSAHAVMQGHLTSHCVAARTRLSTQTTAMTSCAPNCRLKSSSYMRARVKLRKAKTSCANDPHTITFLECRATPRHTSATIYRRSCSDILNPSLLYRGCITYTW